MTIKKDKDLSKPYKYDFINIITLHIFMVFLLITQTNVIDILDTKQTNKSLIYKQKYSLFIGIGVNQSNLINQSVIMKKLFSLSFVFLAFASQASVSAQSLPGNSIPPQKLVDNLCSQIDELDIEDDEDRIAEMVSTQIAELDNPNVDQIVALSQIAVQLKTGQDIDDICD